MAYNPNNNPYIPGDPYSYDLKWIVSEIKNHSAILATLDERIAEAITLFLDQHDPVYYANAGELISSDIKPGSLAYIMGYHTQGDGGANLYYTTDDYNDIISAPFYLTLSGANRWALPIILTPYVTPEMFGAYGDGTEDDTQQLQFACNYGIDHNMDVCLTHNYLITDTIQVKGVRETYKGTGSKIIGNGYTKIIAGDVIQHMIELVPFTNTTAYGVTIKDIYLEGKTLAVNGVYSNISTSECVFENIQITYCTNGMFFNNNCYLNSFRNIRMFGCSGYGILMDNGNNTSNVFEKCYTDNCANGYKINGQYSSMISCCADGVSGIVFEISSFTGSLINCGSEAVNFTRMFKIGRYCHMNVIGGMFWSNPNLTDYYMEIAFGSELNIYGAWLNYSSENSTPGAMLTAGAGCEIRIRDTRFTPFDDPDNITATTIIFKNTAVTSTAETVTVDSDGTAEISLNPQRHTILAVYTSRSGWIITPYAKTSSKYAVKINEPNDYHPMIGDPVFPLTIIYMKNNNI